MIKENHYLAEKIISNIKNYKVIDEIIFPSSNNLDVLKNNDLKKNEDNPVLITNDYLKTKEQDKNEIIQNSIETQEIKMPNKLEENIFEKKSDNQFDIEFNDNNENIIKSINSNNTFNNLSINEEGPNMSNFNQKHFENPIEKDQNIDSYDLNSNSNAISMVDILSEDSLNSIDDLNNIVNINDVYDDLGQNFQNDLINQYKELDKSVSRTPNNLKYSYLPKRKIRDILIDKYNIKNEECVNELYSMAFNNKWKEIDIEHWLLNPTNINNLISKCCENDYIAPEIKKENNEFINLPKKTNEEIKYNNFNNKNDIKEETKEREEPNIKNHTIVSQTPPVLPQNNVIEAKPIFHNQQYSSNIKDDLKSVLIEENYRKMQFDFQTEILKNHIDSKFYTFNANEKNNNEKQSYNDKKINEEFINSKMDLFFNEKKSEILDEINNLKEKFTKNEKVIWDSLDFIRKEIKQNQTSLTTSLSESLETIKNDIENSLNSYIDKIQKKQNISLNKFLENFNNNDSLKPLKESFDHKFEILSNDISQLKQNVNQKNNDLSMDFMDLRKEINDRVNTISNELISNIEDLYDEVEDINESLNNINNLKEKQTINQIIKEDDFKKPVFIDENIKNSNLEKETEELIKNLENKNQELLNKKIEFEIENKDQEIKNKKDEIKFEDNVENKTLPNYLNFLENDEINFDNINKFNEQEMDYGNIDNQLNVNNIDFDYLESSSNEFNDNEINEFDYDNTELSKNDRDFYKNFISDIPSEINNSSKLVSNFDSKKTVTNLDVENKIEIIEEKKEEFDIKSKLSKIDEIIKNSINELNDIKEIVDDKEVRIDDSIKLFEKVK